MYYDRFDIVAAYLTFFDHYHGGMRCKMYSRLSTAIATYAKNFDYSSVFEESVNAQEIYVNLKERLTH